MAYEGRQSIVLVPNKASRGLTAQEKENVRFIEEQFSTVMNHPQEALNQRYTCRS